MTDLEFFIRQTAKQTMISESIVERIIRDQWKYANKASYELKEIEAKGLGTFYPSPKKVAFHTKRLIEKHKWALSNINKGSIVTVIKNVETDIAKLQNTKHYDKAKGYMEKQGVDIGRYQEQCISKEGSGGNSADQTNDL